MSKYTRLGKNTLLVFVGTAGAKFIGLLMLPFYTRWLSVADYGTTDMINIYVILLLSFTTACFAEAIFIFPKGESIANKKSYFSSGLFYAFILLFATGLIFKVAKIVFEYRDISNSFSENIWLIYSLLIAHFLQQYVQQFARSIDKMKVYSMTGVILTGSTALFSFLIIPKYGVLGYVSSLILANLLAAIYSFLFSGSFRFISYNSISKTHCAEMLKFSIPLIPNATMWWLIGSLNRPLMEGYLGLYAVGIFGVANKFPGILNILFGIFSASWQISVLEEFHKKDYSEFYNKIFRLSVFGLVIIFIIITLTSKWLVSVFASSAFHEAWRYIPILTLGVCFSNISKYIVANFSAARKSKYYLYSSIFGAVASILSSIVLIPIWGLMGASISVLFSFIIMTISTIKYSWKYVKIENKLDYFLIVLICFGVLLVSQLIKLSVLYYLLIFVFLLLLLFINYKSIVTFLIITVRKIKK
jgi:O-antigen/teichoic acid export membrane protein